MKTACCVQAVFGRCMYGMVTMTGYGDKVLVVPDPCRRRIIKTSETPKSSIIESSTGTALNTRLISFIICRDWSAQSPVPAAENSSEQSDISSGRYFVFTSLIGDQTALFQYCLHNSSTPETLRVSILTR